MSDLRWKKGILSPSSGRRVASYRWWGVSRSERTAGSNYIPLVFTTNCSLELIDRAFKRPGRIDLVLHFKAPDRALRRRLMERWHEDIRAAIDLTEAVDSTEGYSFAEVEELKNLLVMHFMDSQKWDWDWALKQFAINRNELMARPQRQVVGFGNHVPRTRREEEIPF